MSETKQPKKVQVSKNTVKTGLRLLKYVTSAG